MITASNKVRMIRINQGRYPARICSRTPVAKRLENSAGATARIPLPNARATAFRVPSVVCEGDMSLTASWTQAAVVVSIL